MARYHYDWNNHKALLCRNDDCPEPYHCVASDDPDGPGIRDRMRASEEVIGRATRMQGFDTFPKPFKKKDHALVNRMNSPER